MKKVFFSLFLAFFPAVSVAQTTTFGDTIDIAYSLKGEVYYVSKRTRMLPDFSRFEPKVTLYTNKLDISPRSFTQGFPGVSNRFEWFGVRYTGKFYIAESGQYEFLLNSDDGSKLYIDNKLIIDNDGLHSPLLKKKQIELKEGFHSLQVDYFQGPAEDICLELKVILLNSEKKIPQYFNTYDFAPFGIEKTEEQIKINLPNSILFAFDSAELGENVSEILKELMLFIEKTPFREAMIIGHTDSSGSESYNQKLSERRAKAVYEKIKVLGFEGKDFQIKGRGEKSPIASNATEKGKETNRRVEIVLLK